MPYRRTPAIEQRLADQRTTIVDAATRLLADRGYGACSMAGVAAEAGVASGTVYRHFSGKADLVGEVFRAVVSREVAAVRSVVQDQDSAENRVSALIETFAGRALKSPRLAYALLVEPVDPAVDALRLRFRTDFRDIVAGAVADGVRTGALPPQNPSVVASALIGAIGEALVGPLAAGCEDPDTVPTLITFARRALGAGLSSEE